jgi:hypothetical protein
LEKYPNLWHIKSWASRSNNASWCSEYGRWSYSGQWWIRRSPNINKETSLIGEIKSPEAVIALVRVNKNLVLNAGESSFLLFSLINKCLVFTLS